MGVAKTDTLGGRQSMLIVISEIIYVGVDPHRLTVEVCEDHAVTSLVDLFDNLPMPGFDSWRS